MSASFIFRPCEIEIQMCLHQTQMDLTTIFIDGLDSYPNSKLKVYNRWVRWFIEAIITKTIGMAKMWQMGILLCTCADERCQIKRP